MKKGVLAGTFLNLGAARLLGVPRQDRLRGRARVVVDRDVAVLDVDGLRDQLATDEGGVVAREAERAVRDVDRAGAGEGSVAADLHFDAACRVLVEKHVRPRARGLGGERERGVALEVDRGAGRAGAWGRGIG